MDILLFFAGVGIPIVTIGFFFVLFARIFPLLDTRRWFWWGMSVPIYILAVIYLSQILVASGIKWGMGSFIEHASTIENASVLFFVLYGLLLLLLAPFFILWVLAKIQSYGRIILFSCLLVAAFAPVAYIPDMGLRIAIGAWVGVVIFAWVEELAKQSLAHYLSRQKKENTHAVGVYIALSFALLETIVYAWVSWHHGAGLLMVALLLVLRGVISVSIHVISTQIALGIFSLWSPLLCVIVAIMFHGLINGLLSSWSTLMLYLIALILLVLGSSVCFLLAKKYRFIWQ